MWRKEELVNNLFVFESTASTNNGVKIGLILFWKTEDIFGLDMDEKNRR
jgi:hypothetical protein